MFEFIACSHLELVQLIRQLISILREHTLERLHLEREQTELRDDLVLALDVLRDLLIFVHLVVTRALSIIYLFALPLHVLSLLSNVLIAGVLLF